MTAPLLETLIPLDTSLWPCVCYAVLICPPPGFISHWSVKGGHILAIRANGVQMCPVQSGRKPFSLETPLILVFWGVDLEVPGAGCGGRRWGDLPFLRSAPAPWRMAPTYRSGRWKILQPRFNCERWGHYMCYQSKYNSSSHLFKLIIYLYHKWLSFSILLQGTTNQKGEISV